LFTKNGEIRYDQRCLTFYGSPSDLGVKDKIRLGACNLFVDEWMYSEKTKKAVDEHHIIHRTGNCLEIHEDNINLVLQKCDPSNSRQIWSWKKRD
jgi:hypothetical protein